MQGFVKTYSALAALNCLLTSPSLSVEGNTNHITVAASTLVAPDGLARLSKRRSILVTAAFAPPVVSQRKKRQAVPKQVATPRGCRSFRRRSNNRIAGCGNAPSNPDDYASRLFLAPFANTPEEAVDSFVANSQHFAAAAYESHSEEVYQTMLLAESTGTGVAESAQALSPSTAVAVFLIGIIPFIWATYEFWRRIAFGEPFGTGADSVFIPKPGEEDDDSTITIGQDGDPATSRGRRTLDRGALLVAYALFAIAAFSVGIAIFSVMASPAPPASFDISL